MRNVFCVLGRTWIEDLRCGRDAARYAMANGSIIVTDVQMYLHIVSDEVFEFKVELPSCS
jgi:hypothetical protein